MTMINTDVQVSAYYFSGEAMRLFPRAIEYQGRAVTFREGLRYVIRRGQSFVQLYDMEAEEGHTYRLQRTEGQWTLVGTKGVY